MKKLKSAFSMALLTGFACFAVTTLARAEDVQDATTTDFTAEIGQRGSLCGNLRVPCGSFVLESQLNQKRRVSLKKASVKDALNGVVKKYPSHEWRTAKGVVTITPKSELQRVDHGKSPLERKIASVDISNIPTDQAAQKILEGSGLPSVGRIQMGPRQRYGTVSLHLQNVTLLEALNELIKADGLASWGLEYSKQGKYTVDIYSWRKPEGLFKTKQ
jgi:hypothetical protein